MKTKNPDLSSLCRVRSVKPTDKIKIAPGSTFALDGSWNAKYVADRVKLIPVASGPVKIYRGCMMRPDLIIVDYAIEIDVRRLGDAYASGKIRLSNSKRINKFVVYVLSDGSVRTNSKYVHVIPR
jgi:hypothetical protein